MSGFDAEKTQYPILSRRQVEGQSLCNLGYGDPSKLHHANPRLNFEEVSVIL